jgi:hypothetical protein
MSSDSSSTLGIKLSPIVGCGIAGQLRNAIDVVLVDVEVSDEFIQLTSDIFRGRLRASRLFPSVQQYAFVGKRPKTSAAFADAIASEVLVHAVGQFVAVRKVRHVFSSTIPSHNVSCCLSIARSLTSFDSTCLAQRYR